MGLLLAGVLLGEKSRIYRRATFEDFAAAVEGTERPTGKQFTVVVPVYNPETEQYLVESERRLAAAVQLSQNLGVNAEPLIRTSSPCGAAPSSCSENPDEGRSNQNYPDNFHSLIPLSVKL